MKCRVCKNEDFYPFLNLGHHPPSDQFRKFDQLNQPVTFYPLHVQMCNKCGLAQLDYIVPPEILYQDNYPYEALTTQTGRIHFKEFASSIIEDFKLANEDLVIDIGSNVGILLEGFKNCGLRVLGIDPADNICNIAINRGIDTINDFFNIKSAKEIHNKYGYASVITGSNVFAHIDDWHEMLESIKLLLEPKKGIFVIESPHFLHLINSLEYDTIYHEHLSYISVEPLVSFFENFGMEIIKIEQKDIHGGSIRIFVSNIGNYQVQPSVQAVIQLEKKALLREHATLDEFAKRVNQNREELLNLLRNLKQQGKRVVGVSAPAKGMTLLNYCKIGRETLDYITEKSKLKIGLFSPGDFIPVFGDDQLLIDRPDYALLLAWNFSKEIMNNLSEYAKLGGKFIIPIPNPKII